MQRQVHACSGEPKTQNINNNIYTPAYINSNKTGSGKSGTRAIQQQHSFFFVNLELLRRNVR